MLLFHHKCYFSPTSTVFLLTGKLESQDSGQSRSTSVQQSHASVAQGMEYNWAKGPSRWGSTACRKSYLPAALNGAKRKPI